MALLHDIVEDTSMTFEKLRIAQFSEEIIDGVRAVPRKDGESYADFIERASNDELGHAVKIYDLEDNMNITRLSNIGEKDWHRLFQVNTDGAFYACRAVVPGMVRRKSGNIIIVTSVCGVWGSSCEAAYSATKGALIAFTKSLFKELGPSGIRVNAIAPGVIDTDMTACFTAEEKAAMAADTPLGRIGTPEDVAELAAFLASDRAGFITGQIIGCDGGFAL